MSTTRRAFLRTAVGMLALPMLGMPDALDAHMRRADSQARAVRIKFDRILFDARRAQALNFAETARELGAQTRAVSGDIDDPYYDDLRRRWQNARTPVAGITDFRVLLLLQMMASDAGMRPVLRIHHCGQGASMVHEVFGKEEYRAAAAADLTRAGSLWSGAAARLVLSLAAAQGHGAVDVSAANRRDLDSRMLVTWAIA